MHEWNFQAHACSRNSAWRRTVIVCNANTAYAYFFVDGVAGPKRVPSAIPLWADAGDWVVKNALGDLNEGFMADKMKVEAEKRERPTVSMKETRLSRFDLLNKGTKASLMIKSTRFLNRLFKARPSGFQVGESVVVKADVRDPDFGDDIGG